jgi:hypothetical protein
MPAWEKFAKAAPQDAQVHREPYEGVGDVESRVFHVPSDPALLPENSKPARGLVWLKDAVMKHWAEVQFPLGLRKSPKWGDLRP